MSNCVFIDESFLIAEKPADLLCVPGRGEDKQDCLLRRLHANFPEALIVHRLDMATSGLVLLARSKAAQRVLSIQFQQREVEKRYLAMVSGLVRQDSGTINLPLGADWPNRPRQKVDYQRGKAAVTYFRVLKRDRLQGVSTLELSPVTGRTHQLRVHLEALGHPILGDKLYGDEKVSRASDRLLLHACEIGFTHPQTAQRVSFHSQAGFPCA